MNRREDDKQVPATLATIPLVKKMVEVKKEEFSKYLKGSNVRPEQFALMAVNCVIENKELLKCSPESFIKALRECADLRLPPSGAHGWAWIIPFKGTATMIPGYRGLIELARRSGEVLKIESGVAFEEDYFTVSGGDDPKIVHRPSMDADRTKLGSFFYAIASLKNGERVRDWMSRSEVEQVRNSSRSPGSPMWAKYFNEAGRKTVVRRLCKYLPMTEELATAIDRDDRQFKPEVEWRDRPVDFARVIDAEKPKAPAAERPAGEKYVERAIELQEQIRRLGGSVEPVAIGELDEKALDDYLLFLLDKISDLESDIGK